MLFISSNCTGKFITLVAASIAISHWCFGQSSRITGRLSDRTGEPVSNASVLLKNGDNRIIGFNFSGGDGRYTIAFSDTLQRSLLVVEVDALGYKIVRQSLRNKKNEYDFQLEETAELLKEVVVKNKPVILSKRDTLRYDVASFARDEDRTIGDVLRHMPGIGVGENGQLYYNGKTIENLYIHGDDLMDGRYGLAVKTITWNMIKSVDVMQHFQPIKVLKDKAPTDNTVINLVLKDENSLKMAGSGMLAAGTPKLYDVEMNTVLLNRKFKTLNSFKANNSGIDYQNDFFQYNATRFLTVMENMRPRAVLSDGVVGDPDLPRQNYYRNESAELNANNLFNTKDSLQLKANIQLFFDRNSVDYNSETDYYLPGDTVQYKSLQNALRKPMVFNNSLTAMVNKTSYYFNNKLSFNLSGYTNSSTINFNGNPFSQSLYSRTYDVSNDLQFAPAEKKGIIDFRWYVDFYNNPQRLSLSPGPDSNLINNNQSYETARQNASIPCLFSNFSLNILTNNRRMIKETYGAGIINEWQQLNSDLDLVQTGGSVSPYQGDAGNALHWRRNMVYASSLYTLKKNDWEASLSVPLYWQQIRYSQVAYSLDSSRRDLFLKPSASIRLYVNTEDYLSAGYSSRRDFGEISSVYRGVILTSYQSLSASEAGLQPQKSSEIFLRYNFQRNITMLFMNAGISYTKVVAGSILSTTLSDNVQHTILLPVANDQSSLVSNAGASKYIFKLHATASINTEWKRSWYSQYFNNLMLPYRNDVFSAAGSLSGKWFNCITVRYDGKGAWSNSRPLYEKDSVSQSDEKVRRLDQALALGYSPAKVFFVSVRARDIYSKQPEMESVHYFFMGGNIRYKPKKGHMEFELAVDNVFDVRNYKILTLLSNQFTVSDYGIRGRMALLRATFSL